MTGMGDRYDEVLERQATPDELNKAAGGFWGKLRGVLTRVPFARDAVALYYFLIDPKADLGLRGKAALAILYFISPLDLIPDAIPLAGFVDDAMVIAAAVSMLARALGPYKQRAEGWVKRGSRPEPEVVKEAEVIRQ